MRLELDGQKFNRLTAISEVAKRGNLRMWKCLCDCGNTAIVAGVELRRGHTKSCGCLNQENRQKAGLANRTHGMSRSPEYMSWHNMMKRCLNPKHPRFPDYGGRGITVCERWRTFPNFLKDMGMKPTTRHQIERRDNDGQYCKANCCWALPKEQAQNTRVNRRLTHDGITLTITQWAERIGIRHTTLSLRLDRGWSVSKTLTAPLWSFLKRDGNHV